MRRRRGERDGTITHRTVRPDVPATRGDGWRTRHGHPHTQGNP